MDLEAVAAHATHAAHAAPEGAEAGGPERLRAEHVAPHVPTAAVHRLRDRVRHVDVADRVHELLERLVDMVRHVNVNLARHRDRHRHVARDLHLLDNLVRHVDVARDRDLARDLHRNRNRHRHLPLDFPGHRHVAVLHMRHLDVPVDDLRLDL